MTKKILIVLSAVALLAMGFVLGVYGSHQNASFGATSYDVNNFIGDVYQGMGRVLMMQNGVFVGPISTGSNSVTIGTGGTAISKYFCGSNASYNPPSLATNATTTQAVTVSGAVPGDRCAASLTSATSSTAFNIGCNITANGTSTVTIQNLDATVDFATGTLRACIIH